MYSFTRVLMGPNEARMLIDVRSVVSSTRTRLMPSTPTLYWMPKKLIQSTSCTSWKPSRSLSKLTAMSSEMPSATSEMAKAPQRWMSSRLPGTKSRISAPMSGVRISSVSRSGRSRKSVISGPSG